MIKLVYISSPSYSGSTLLTFLLNAHPSIATIGELKWGAIDIETYRCSCGNLLRDCGFWRKVASSMVARGLTFDVTCPGTDFRCRGHWPADRIARASVRDELFEQARDAMVAVVPSLRRRWSTIARVNQALIEAILEIQGGAHFLDGSKEPVRLKYLMDTRNYDVRLIQLVRDARGVTNSAIKNGRFSAEFGATEWLRIHQQVERLSKRLEPNQVLRVRYEDVCREPDASVARICEFIGVDAADLARDFRSVEHHILGNRMRLDVGRALALDEKWRKTLSPMDLETIDRVAGKMNRSYGYA